MKTSTARAVLTIGTAAVLATGAVLWVHSAADSPSSRLDTSVSSSLTDLPFDPGPRPLLAGSTDHLFIVEDATEVGAPTTGRFARFDQGRGWVGLPEPAALVSPVAGLTSTGLTILALRCSGDLPCDEADVVSTTFDLGTESWTPLSVVRSAVDAELWSALFSGSTGGSAVFLAGSDAVVIERDFHQTTPLDHPYALCAGRSTITALVPTPADLEVGAGNPEAIETPRIGHVSVVELPLGGSSSPQPAEDPPQVADADELVTPVCTSDGLLLAGGKASYVWTTSTRTWSVSNTVVPVLDVVVQVVRLADGRTVALTPTAAVVVGGSGEVMSSRDLPRPEGFAIRQIVALGTKVFLYEHSAGPEAAGKLVELATD